MLVDIASTHGRLGAARQTTLARRPRMRSWTAMQPVTRTEPTRQPSNHAGQRHRSDRGRPAQADRIPTREVISSVQPTPSADHRPAGHGRSRPRPGPALGPPPVRPARRAAGPAPPRPLGSADWPAAAPHRPALALGPPPRGRVRPPVRAAHPGRLNPAHPTAPPSGATGRSAGRPDRHARKPAHFAKRSTSGNEDHRRVR
jgi:hypothetical protein